MSEEGTMSEYESINVLMPRVAAAIGNIAKTRKAEAGQARYRFRGIDDVLDAIHEHLADALVTPYPSVVSLERDDRVLKGDRGERYQSVATLTLRVRFVGPLGDEQVAEAAAEGQDFGDKAIAKAGSVAYRTIMIQTFTIPVSSPETNVDAEQDTEDGSMAQGDVAAPETGEVMTKSQGSRIAALFEAKGFPADAMIRHAYVGAIIGREFTSVRSLTKSEAQAIITALEAEVEER